MSDKEDTSLIPRPSGELARIPPGASAIIDGMVNDATNLIHSRDAARQDKTGMTGEEAAAKRRTEWKKNTRLNRIGQALKEKWTLFPPNVRVEMWGTIEEPQNRPERSLLAYLRALIWAIEMVGPEIIGERTAEVLEELDLMYSLDTRTTPSWSAYLLEVVLEEPYLMYPLTQQQEERQEEWMEEAVDGLQAVDNQRELAEDLAWGLDELLSYEPLAPWEFLD